MKSRVKLAVLKILLLREEFSANELSEAVDLISNGKTEALLAWLTGGRGPESRQTTKSVKRIDKQQSKAVIELSDKEPELYVLLRDLDGLLRKGVLLPRLEDVRRLGGELKKDFEAGKSRKAAVPRLMDVLANEPLDRVRGLAKRLIDGAAHIGGREAEYQKLAAFLIHGRQQ